MNQRWVWWLWVVAVLGWSGCSDDDSSVREWSSAIVNGLPVGSTEHTEVVALTDGNYLCTGTLLTPRVVLTAAHCVKDMGTSRMKVLFGNSIYSATQVSVVSTWAHPQAMLKGTGFDDLGLVRMSKDAPTGTKTVPYLRGVDGIQPADLGAAVELVGFGRDGSGVNGTKLQTPNDISFLCEDPEGCVWPEMRILAPPNTICYDNQPGSLCSGDSGGPAFFQRGSVSYVGGVSIVADEKCLKLGCSLIVSRYEKYVARFIGRVLSADCTSPADCDSGHCVGGICCESECPDACHTCSDDKQPGRCVPKLDNQTCGSGDRCVGGNVCRSGSCVAVGPMDCSDDNPCSQDSCDPIKGCSHALMAAGSPCDNGDVCDGHEVCESGICAAGTPPTCDDGDTCTVDSCAPALGCQHVPAMDGLGCEKAACGQGVCKAGKCSAAGGFPLCDDRNSCTRDECGNGGCVHTPINEGYACGRCMGCRAGACVPTPNCSPSDSGCAISGGPEAREPASVWMAWVLLMGFMLWRRSRSQPNPKPIGSQKLV